MSFRDLVCGTDQRLEIVVRFLACLELYKQGLIELQSKYTDDYPDVKAAKREVAQLQAEITATPPVGSQASGTQSIPNPVYIQTQSKMSDAQTDVALQYLRFSDAQAALDNAKKMTSSAIEVQTKFADLDRDYDLVHKTYQELLDETNWENYGRGKNDKCENCMAHCGYEPTAVLKTTGSIKESIRAAFDN